MAKMGSEAAPRLVAAYYPVTIAALLLLLPPDGRTVHRRWWRAIAYAAMIMAFVLIVLNPARPLLPERWIIGGLRLLHPPASAVAHLEAHYRLRALRRDGLAPLRAAIPPTETIIGCVSGDDNPSISLWLPFGSREVVEVMPGTARPDERRIRYVVVDGNFLRARYHLAPGDLFGPGSATVVRREDISFQGSHAHGDWYLLHLSGS